MAHQKPDTLGRKELSRSRADTITSPDCRLPSPVARQRDSAPSFSSIWQGYIRRISVASALNKQAQNGDELSAREQPDAHFAITQLRAANSLLARFTGIKSTLFTS